MSLLFIIPVICITCIINSQYNKIKVYNNEILEQKEAINKISRICESLSISKILNHIYNYNISYKYIIISIIIIVINIILLLITLFDTNINRKQNNAFQMLIFIILLIIVLFIILYFNHKYINKNEEEINNKGIEIINKKDEINNIYYKKLLIIFNDNCNYNDINSNIDEYISNHSHIYNIYVKNCIKIINCNKYILKPIVNIRKDKRILLNDIRNDLIKNKKDELMIIMNAKFKTFKEITPEIVKNELDEYDNILDIYKTSLELKIKNINDLLRINDCIINII